MLKTLSWISVIVSLLGAFGGVWSDKGDAETAAEIGMLAAVFGGSPPAAPRPVSSPVR